MLNMENAFGYYFKYHCGFCDEDMQDPQLMTLKPDRRDI